MTSDEISERKLWAPPLPGTLDRIGRYTVIKTLGVGGMASIYLARATGKGGFEKWVAIKRPHPHLADRPSIVNMILNEARLVARFDHENICPIIDVDADESGPYIVMPYLHGEHLAELIRTFVKIDRPIPVDIVAYAGACVADGLHYAHNARSDEGTPLDVIHRDISPQNIFITFQGSVKVLDFGVAKAIGFESETAVGALKGKYAYMSPEQVRGETVDRRSDLFSLGVVLWETLACRRLFKKDTDRLTADAVAAYRAPLISDVTAHVPLRLAEVIDRALEPDRRNRYQTALELAQSLRSFLGERRAFISSTDVQKLMKSTFPARAETGDPFSNATEIDQPLRRTATDMAVPMLLAFDEVSKVDATERMEPVSISKRSSTVELEAAACTMPDRRVEDLFGTYGTLDDSQETIPPLPKRRAPSEDTDKQRAARAMSEATLRPTSVPSPASPASLTSPFDDTADEGTPSLDADGVASIDAPTDTALEEKTLDPTFSSTEDSPALDVGEQRTLQLPPRIAQAIIKEGSKQPLRSESEPLVFPVYTTPPAEPAERAARAEPATPTSKMPARRKEEADRRLAQSVLGIALILLALSIVLWARQCNTPAHAEPAHEWTKPSR